MTYPIRYKADFSPVTDVDKSRRIVSGYFASFDTVDSAGDVIRKGAFDKTISENGPQSAKPRIAHLLNHDTRQPLSDLKELFPDSKGLRYTGQVGTHQLGVDFVEMADSGLIKEHSFMYRVIKANQLSNRETAKEGDAIWELTELKMFEGSSLTFRGVNENTPLISLKADDLDELMQRRKDLEAFCRNSRASDTTIKMLLDEHEILLHMIEAMKADLPEPGQTTQPRSLDWAAIAQAIQ